jgi:catechol 2,3-dioxygenase-like lactoylglutathione lyase family enzyme
MLGDHAVHTTLPAGDMQRAKQFYSDTLGLSVESESPGGIFFRSGDTHFLVFPTGGKPSGSHTQMGWMVNDIEAEVSDLKSRGVTFETYEFPGFDPATHVATTDGVKAAWFQDSEGNLLGIVQLP